MEMFEGARESSWLTDAIPPEKMAANDALAILSAEIQFARLDLGMNQKEFAHYMGVSQGMVSRWESGEYNFTVEVLARIAYKLHRSVESLFTPTVFEDTEKFVDLADGMQPELEKAVPNGSWDRMAAFSESLVQNRSMVRGELLHA